MNKQISILLAAGIMMAGVPAATAAIVQPNGSATMSQTPSDTLDLTKTQRTTAWNDLQNGTEGAVQLRSNHRFGCT